MGVFDAGPTRLIQTGIGFAKQANEFDVFKLVTDNPSRYRVFLTHTMHLNWLDTIKRH